MIVNRDGSEGSIEYDELATLKHLALEGAANGTITISCAGVSEALGVSAQTISRRLQELENGGYLDRSPTKEGQNVSVTTSGLLELKREFTEYERIFTTMSQLRLDGVVKEGAGEGAFFISLDGYSEQFEQRLGYKPYPGTLNVALTRDASVKREILPLMQSIHIEEWKDGDDTYGAVECYPVSVRNMQDETFEPAHIIYPHETHHREEILEIVAPEKLRETLDLENGLMVEIEVNC